MADIFEFIVAALAGFTVAAKLRLDVRAVSFLGKLRFNDVFSLGAAQALH
jgi:hypothetical protein